MTAGRAARATGFALAAALAQPLASPAQPPGRRALPTASGVGVPSVRVTGVVHDSLLGAPLAGATVTRPGAPGVAFTDSAGRFALDSVPAAPGRFVVSHPALDSAGLADVVVPLDLTGAGDSAAVVLATPSRATVRARLCGPGAGASPAGQAPNAADTPDRGVVFGELRDALDTLGGLPLAGAEAALAWVSTAGVRGVPQVPRPRSRLVRSDAAGAWAACGLPLGTPIDVRGAAGARTSGRVTVALGPRGVVRVDLWVGGDPGARGPAAAGVAAPVTGLVRDSLGAAFAGARVTVDEVDGLEARTDAAGRFRLAGVPPGTRTLVVRAIGYPPAVTEVVVRAGTPAQVDVTLRRIVTLPRVTVRARAANAERLAADLDRRRRFPRGYFADTAVIRAFGARRAVAALPIGLVRGDDVEWVVRFSKRGLRPGASQEDCSATLFVDGEPREWAWTRWIDARRVVAVEVYRTALDAPAQYRGGCGSVLVWTEAIR